LSGRIVGPIAEGLCRRMRATAAWPSRSLTCQGTVSGHIDAAADLILGGCGTGHNFPGDEHCGSPNGSYS